MQLITNSADLSGYSVMNHNITLVKQTLLQNPQIILRIHEYHQNVTSELYLSIAEKIYLPMYLNAKATVRLFLKTPFGYRAFQTRLIKQF